MTEKPMNEQESLQLITEMIGKVRDSIHDRGTSAILWGSVIAFCGLASFAQMQWGFYIGFDVWILTLLALAPQIFISIRERRERRVWSHMQEAMNAVWLVYGVSLFALVFYLNTVPDTTDRLLAAEGIVVLQQKGGLTTATGMFIPSSGSLLLLLYAFPTLTTGLARRFRPMLVGAALCYVFFVLSCFTNTAYDMLLNGLAGICNWLVPGLILRRRFLRGKAAAHV